MSKPIHVRIRRRNQTFYVLCHASQTAIHIKQEIALALQGHDEDPPSDPSEMKLTDPTGKELEDEDSLQSLSNEAELHVVFPIADDEWEPVEIVEYEAGTD
eukprot:CAMPEP_0116852384 /NCGR_PEP_ID=MMETSP0418-20121206/17262_1 /TAXON_ID=1158023 /ORGANISM="Astrosyne radiata, Strain 13vi08-1A" /LENGTH=100 /DNA_ID=CAMNT_0004484539 /DNA_START=129 /DNA_END=431 /DNA_ORIENTATION=-